MGHLKCCRVTAHRRTVIQPHFCSYFLSTPPPGDCRQKSAPATRTHSCPVILNMGDKHKFFYNLSCCESMGENGCKCQHFCSYFLSTPPPGDCLLKSAPATRTHSCPVMSVLNMGDKHKLIYHLSCCESMGRMAANVFGPQLVNEVSWWQ